MENPEILIQEKRFNDAIKNWGHRAYRELQREIFRLRIGVSGEGSATMTWKGFKRYGTINRVQFKFERYMVFVHKGVGRGWPINTAGRQASAWNAASSGKGRYPKPWFNPVIEKNLQELANTAAKHKAEIAAKRLMIN